MTIRSFIFITAASTATLVAMAAADRAYPATLPEPRPCEPLPTCLAEMPTPYVTIDGEPYTGGVEYAGTWSQ